MTSNQLKHQAKLKEWADAIQECRSSSMSVREWCRNHGVTATTYYRWERQLLSIADGSRDRAQEPDNTTTFAELPMPQGLNHTVAQQAATIRLNDIAIDIYSNVNANLLKILIEVAKSC